MVNRNLLFVCLFLLGVIPTSNAASITTLFSANNGGAVGGAVYFDLQVGNSALSITGLDINTSSTAVFNDFGVWLLSGITSQGNETSVSWSQVATGSGTGAGQDNPTGVTLSNSISLDANTLYGIALTGGTNIDHDYTNGDGTNQSYSNADLDLSFGTASNVPFTGTIFNPRVWNGTIFYSVPAPGVIALMGLGLVVLVYQNKKNKSA